MTSKQFLEQSIRIANDIKAHCAELAYLHEVSLATGAIRYDTDKVIHSITEAKFERPVLRIKDLEDEVKDEIRELLVDHEEIRKAIAQIEDQDVRTVIRYKYLANIEIDVIAYRMNISRRTVTRRLELGYAEVARITGYPAPIRPRLPAEERHGDARRILRDYFEEDDYERE